MAMDFEREKPTKLLPIMQAFLDTNVCSSRVFADRADAKAFTLRLANRDTEDYQIFEKSDLEELVAFLKVLIHDLSEDEEEDF